jgi:hypothetical protein
MNRLFGSRILLLTLLLALISAASVPAADDVAALVATIKAVGKEGAGNPAASQAWSALARLGPGALPAVLAGFEDDNPVVINWLRAAADAIGDRALRDKKLLPARVLETFLLDTNNPAAGRYAAYQWLLRADPTAQARLLPGFLRDRSPELRRESVETRLQAAKIALAKGDKTAATLSLREALSGACDKDQVDRIANNLDEQGIKVDVAAHFGFIRSWQVIGPFDNAGGTKLPVVYAPEKTIDLKATCKGKGNVACRWTPFTTDLPYGKLDFNKAIAHQKGVIAYAWVAVDSPTERPAELRIGTATGIKAFHNGKEVLCDDEYFTGIPDMDRFVIPITLRAGKNEILIKVGQNEDKGPWTEQWFFQARICDSTGAAIPLHVTAKPAATPAGRS